MPDKPKTFSARKGIAKQGGSATLRDTGAGYKRQRLAILDAEPLCRYCLNRGHITRATILDHLLALSLGGTNDPANLVPACKACNDTKALAERAYLQRGYDLGSVRYDAELSGWFKLAVKPAKSA